MAKKKEYHWGDVLNLETGVVFIRELPQRENKRYVEAFCGNDGNVFIGRLDRILHDNQVCPECQKQKKVKKHYYPGQILNEDTGTVLLYLTKRDKKGSQYGYVKCGICGNEYETKLHIVEKGSKCRLCRQKAIKDAKTIYKEGDYVNSKKGQCYLFLKEIESKRFKSRKTRYGIFVLVDKDSKEPLSSPFKDQLGHILEGGYTGNGSSCGEVEMNRILSTLNVNYQKEYSFDDLYRYKGYPLRFDFAVFYPLKTILFELDGPQHQESVDFFGGEEGLKDLQYRDEMKNDYVAKHDNLMLIRIPYQDYPKITTDYIVDILNKELQGGE